MRRGPTHGGRRGREIGTEHERLVVASFNAMWAEFPEWLTDIRSGSDEEDRNGIDAVAVTVLGDIGFQIKSSNRFVKAHFAKYPDVPVFVARFGENERSLRARLLRFLSECRVVIGTHKDGSMAHLESCRTIPPTIGYMEASDA